MARKSVSAMIRKLDAAKLKPHTVQRDERVTMTDEEWLSHNYAAPAPAPEPERLSPIEASILSFQNELDVLDNDNSTPDCKAVTPGLVRVSSRPEPKSIHSPVAESRLRFIRAKKRYGAVPQAANVVPL